MRAAHDTGRDRFNETIPSCARLTGIRVRLDQAGKLRRKAVQGIAHHASYLFRARCAGAACTVPERTDKNRTVRPSWHTLAGQYGAPLPDCRGAACWQELT